MPALAACLVALRTSGAPRARLRTAARATAPLWTLLAVYFVWRWLALGRVVGGYDQMQFGVGTMALGLARTTLHLLVPLSWSHAEPCAEAWLWLSGTVVLAAIGPALRRPRRLVAVALFALACAPMATFLASAHNPHNLRYWYLPTAALVGLLAAPGRVVAALVLASWLYPLWHVRAEVTRADRASRAVHGTLQQVADAGAPAPLFVAGLPRGTADGTSLQYHFGVDRVLQPPFRRDGVGLFALRPIADGPLVFRRDDGALPLGSTWQLDGSAITRVPPPPPLPDLPISGDVDANGTIDLSYARLHELVQRGRPLALRTAAGRPQAFRLTLFTATGYFCCLFPDHGPAEADHGTIDLETFFLGRPNGTRDGWLVSPTTYAHGEAFVMRGLEVPTTIDLEPSFPVQLEAGALQGDRFVPSHRARRLLTFAFDRDYPRWVREALAPR